MVEAFPFLFRLSKRFLFGAPCNKADEKEIRQRQAEGESLPEAPEALLEKLLLSKLYNKP